MNRSRIKATIIRQVYTWRHNLDRLSDTFYWPAMDLILWGVTSVYIRNNAPNMPFIIVAIVTGLIFWLIIWRSQYEITVGLLTEMWDRNLVNIFSSPLKISEWITASMVLGVIKMFFSVSFAVALAFFLYKTTIFSFGFLLIPFMASLLLTGWGAGFLVAGLIIRFGMTIQSLAWTGVAVLIPFSAVYYPVSTLPLWAQKIAMLVPSSHIFEGMREVIFTGVISYDKLLVSFALNIIYLILSIWFFVFMFNQSRKLGLGRLI